MKTLKFFLILLSTSAYFFLLGCVGGYEAGKILTPELLACCGGSVAVVWASLAAIDKIERGGK